MHKLWGFVACVGLLALAEVAEARRFGAVEFEAPSGWNEAGRTDPRAEMLELYPYEGGGKIAIRVRQKGGDAKAVAKKQLPYRSSVVNEGEVSVAGADGYYVAARQGETLWIVAAAIGPEGGVAFLVSGAEDVFEAANNAFAEMVDAARLVGDDAAPPADAPPPRRDDGDAGYGDAGTAPAEHVVTLRSIGEGCTAVMTFDGQTYRLGDGESTTLRVRAGAHTFRWTNNDGSAGEVTADVPQYDTFSGGCQATSRAPKGPSRPAPVDEAPAAPAEAAPRGGGYTDDQLTLGAQYHLLLTFSGINIVVGTNIQVTDAQMNGWLADAVPAARRDPAWARVLVQMIDAYPQFLQEWNGAVERNDTAMQYQTMRAAARYLASLAPADFPLEACGDGDEIDCLIAAKRRTFQEAQASARRRRQIEDAMYWNTMFNIAQMQHNTSMNIIGNF